MALYYRSCVVAVLLVLAAAVACYASNSTTTETFPPPPPESSWWSNTEWAQDLMNLPADVPFPGTAWLDRIAVEKKKTEFVYKDVTYSSVYAAILENDPLKHPCRNFNAYLNSMFLSPEAAVTVMEQFSFLVENLEVWHYIFCYWRNLVAGMLVYYLTAGIFSYFCYVHKNISKSVFEDQNRERPSQSIIWDQIGMAQTSMIIYVMLPCLDEYVIEAGWTATYFTLQEIGGIVPAVGYLMLYIAAVEIGIYWVHRTLHTNKFLYKYVHMPHHKYNSAETLTPWASIAFHPVDGMMQCSPYVIVCFFVPCHYAMHLFLLFFSAVWATYIHDAMDWNIDPVMGSKYHTVHHTHYIYNYGQFFTFCDAFWGTLRVPAGPTGTNTKREKKKI